MVQKANASFQGCRKEEQAKTGISVAGGEPSVLFPSPLTWTPSYLWDGTKDGGCLWF